MVQITTVKGSHVQLKVVGLFQSGLLEIDKVQSYTSLTTAQMRYLLTVTVTPGKMPPEGWVSL